MKEGVGATEECIPRGGTRAAHVADLLAVDVRFHVLFEVALIMNNASQHQGLVHTSCDLNRFDAWGS